MKWAHVISMLLLLCAAMVTQSRSLTFCDIAEGQCQIQQESPSKSCCRQQKNPNSTVCCLLIDIDDFLPLAMVDAPEPSHVTSKAKDFFILESQGYPWFFQLHAEDSPHIYVGPPNLRSNLGVYLI
jgi:hypothetical protein